MKIFFILLPCLLLILPATLEAKSKIPCDRWSAENLIYASKKSTDEAQTIDNARQRLVILKKGIQWANKCASSFPEEAGCYYYRAVATGLYYETSVIRYQKGLKKMIADLNQVIQQDPSYDQGGAFLILGYLFLKTPQFSFKKGAITQDVPKALEYAQKALSLAPTKFENQLLLAEIFMEQENYPKALPLLKELKQKISLMNKTTPTDKKNGRLIDHLLAKAQKKLTKKS